MMNTLTRVTTNPASIYIRPQEPPWAQAEDNNDFFVIANNYHEEVEEE